MVVHIFHVCYPERLYCSNNQRNDVKVSFYLTVVARRSPQSPDFWHVHHFDLQAVRTMMTTQTPPRWCHFRCYYKNVSWGPCMHSKFYFLDCWRWLPFTNEERQSCMSSIGCLGNNVCSRCHSPHYNWSIYLFLKTWLLHVLLLPKEKFDSNHCWWSTPVFLWPTCFTLYWYL